MGNTVIRGGVRNVRTRGFALLALAAAISLGITATTVATAPAAFAADYPTWDEVTEARHDVKAAKAAINRIEALLADLKRDAERTQKDAEEKGNIWQEADNKYQAAASRAETLQKQADEANTKANDSELQAGQMAAQLMRGGGGDISANLLLNSGDADDLLYGLGMSTKISEQANAIYERALLDKNTAQALTDQADVAKAELAVLKEASEKAFKAAQKAAEAASTALETQLEHQAQLQQQLIVLKERRAATEADYLKGVREKFNSDASLDAGEISESGWVKPAGGYITSVYGWSAQYGSSFHKGTDLGAGCGANIYAASSGKVDYAGYGWNGGYGNYIILDHGSGVKTAYGHIVDGGIKVKTGQSIGVGTVIANVGTTGNSTGCHLHFEVRINGYTTDPVPYMKSQGIRLG